MTSNFTTFLDLIAQTLYCINCFLIICFWKFPEFVLISFNCQIRIINKMEYSYPDLHLIYIEACLNRFHYNSKIWVLCFKHIFNTLIYSVTFKYRSKAPRWQSKSCYEIWYSSHSMIIEKLLYWYWWKNNNLLNFAIYVCFTVFLGILLVVFDMATINCTYSIGRFWEFCSKVLNE